MLIFNLNLFFLFTFFLFLIGFQGVLILRTNVLIILMAIEIIFLSLIYNLLGLSLYFNDLSLQIYVLFILLLIATESALGLAILVVYYRIKGVIDLNAINNLKG